MKQAVSIVIPVYNEECNIFLLVEAIKKVEKKIERDVEIILVDDGSCDRSFDAMKKCLRNFPETNIKIIRFEKNFGQTAAIAAGVDNARNGIVVTMDGDLQNDPEDIPALLDGIEEGYDVVSGWRKRRKDNFLTRRMPSCIANGIISLCTGVRLHDHGCTLKAYRKEEFAKINLYGELHRFIPALMSWQGARIKEIPVKHHKREFGKSKYGLSRTMSVVIDLVTVRVLLSAPGGTVPAFIKSGLFFLVSGCAMGLIILLKRYALGEHIVVTIFFYLSALLIAAGLQLVTLGFIVGVNLRIYQASQGSRNYKIVEIC